ncbi:hypothetical protein SAMN05444746_12278 [Variovorax sp. OK212]|nr:hypothetical protein SAMN05518853_12278 [Variovorax sp. OK202]SFE36867.1 hypothetical protein SAMN05444746_12278 [Variovorax sp. OK212]
MARIIGRPQGLFGSGGGPCHAPVLVTNAGGPPPVTSARDRERWISALDAKMLAPVALIRATMHHDSAAVRTRVAHRIRSGQGAGRGVGPVPWCTLQLTGFVAGLARQPHGTTSRSTTCFPATSTRTESQGSSKLARTRRGTQLRLRVQRSWLHRRRADSVIRKSSHCVRIPGQRPRRLCHWPEPVDGRWSLPRHAISQRRQRRVKDTTRNIANGARSHKRSGHKRELSHAQTARVWPKSSSRRRRAYEGGNAHLAGMSRGSGRSR